MTHLVRRRVGAGLLALLFGSSIWLYAHEGLGLMVDAVTGKKGCVSMLALYVGLAESDWRFAVVQWYSLLWAPMALGACVWLLVKVARWMRKAD